MSDFRMVFGVQLKARFSPADTLRDLKANPVKFMKKAGMGLLILISIASLIGTWGFFLYSFYNGLAQVGMLDLGLMMPYLTGIVVVLVFGIAGVLGLLFQSKDIAFLASLPVRQGAVFASKFLLVYLYELTLLLVFLIPAIVVYGVIAGMGPLFYVTGLLVVLLLPMLPLTFSTLFSLVIMRLSGFSRHRDLLLVLVGFVFTVGLVAGQFLFNSKLAMMNQEEILELLKKANGVVLYIGRFFPPALWAVLATVETGMDQLLYGGLHILTAGAAFAAAYAVGSKIYLSGALANQETSRRGKKARFNPAQFSAGSQLKAVARMEFRNILRSPIYSLNSLIGVVLFPLMILLMPLSVNADPDVQQLQTFINSLPESMMLLVFLGIGLLVCTTNLASSTVLSREGPYFWLIKALPVPYKTQAYGKLLFSWAVDAVTITLCGVVAWFAYPAFRQMLLPAYPLALIGAIPLTCGNMMLDFLHPKMKWSSEAEAMKQNLNGLLGMALSALLGAGIVYIGYLISRNGTALLTISILFVLVTALAVGATRLLGFIADKKLKTFEP